MVAFDITLTDVGNRIAGVTTPTTPAGSPSGTETDKANSGNAITLSVRSLTFRHECLLNTKPYKKYKSNVNTNEFMMPEVDKGGVGVPTWSIEGTLNMNLAADRVIFGNLRRLVLTKGFKRLGTTIDTNNPIMIRHCYETEVDFVNVRVASFRATQSGRSKDGSRLDYTLELVETI